MTVEICPATSKVRYATFAKARKGLRHLQKEKQYQGVVFMCESCHGYHVGRQQQDGPKKIAVRKIAAARDRWLESEEGVWCAGDPVEWQYLKNRLERAFMAGIYAALDLVQSELKRKKPSQRRKAT